MRGVIIAALLAFVIFAVPSLVGADWLTTFASVSIYSIAAAGFGILYGRVGMISLGQIALLSLGCWIGTRLAYATSMPFPVLLIVTGLITWLSAPGRPAVARLSVSISRSSPDVAGARRSYCRRSTFECGGGFTGRSATGSVTSTPPVRRPSIAVAAPRSSIHRRRHRADVLLRWCMSPQTGACVGVVREQPRAGRRRKHHGVQDVGVRARVVHDRRRRLPAAQVGVPRAILPDAGLITLAASMIGGIYSIRGGDGRLFNSSTVPLPGQWGVPNL